MQSIYRTFLASILAILLVCACTSKEGDNKAHAGYAPDFSLKDLKGHTLRLKDLRGKVVLLNFFATWCGPCRQEIPHFVRLYKKFRDKGLEIVGISLDMGGTTLLNRFVSHYGITYPILLGTREVVVDYGGIQGIPTSFLINHKGVVAERFIGLRPARLVEKSVTQLLQEKAGL